MTHTKDEAIKIIMQAQSCPAWKAEEIYNQGRLVNFSLNDDLDFLIDWAIDDSSTLKGQP